MPSTRDSLLASIETLHADAQKLTGNTIEDEPHRQSIRNQISRLKNDTATPYERAWEIFFQVRSRDVYPTIAELKAKHSPIKVPL